MTKDPARTQDLVVVLLVACPALLAVLGVVAAVRDGDLSGLAVEAAFAVALAAALRALWRTPRAWAVQVGGLLLGVGHAVVARGWGDGVLLVGAALMIWVVVLDRLEVLRISRNGVSTPV